MVVLLVADAIVGLGLWPGHDPASVAGAMAFLSGLGGALLKAPSDIVAFEFGSSRGSKNKDEQLGALAEHAGDPALQAAPIAQAFRSAR